MMVSSFYYYYYLLLFLFYKVSENDHPNLLHPPHILEVQSRVTCDVLSFLGVNHAACAAHCLYLRYRGGYCNERRVCVCRS